MDGCVVPLAPFGRPALLWRGRADLATDGPNEAGELACDCGDGHGLELAPADQRSVAPVEAALRFPGNLANRRRGSVDLVLLDGPHARGMLIAPRAFHQHPASTPVSGLGDGAA